MTKVNGTVGRTFDCLLCEQASIPNMTLDVFRNSSTCDQGMFHVDLHRDICSFCQLGYHRGKPLSTASAARKIVIERGYSDIFFVGSSTFRHVYHNLVSAFRDDNEHEQKTIIEHYYQDNSFYYFNGTHDVFQIRDRRESDLINISHSFHHLWIPDLKRSVDDFVSKLKQSPTHGKSNTMLIIGNHFWNTEFHSNIPVLVKAFFDLYAKDGRSPHDVTLVWVHAWPWGKWAGRSRFNPKIQELQVNSASYLRELRGRLVTKQRIIEIDLVDIASQASINLTQYYMKEDGMHFACNHLTKWPEKMMSCDKHKHHMGMAQCTDPVNDLIIKQIDRELTRRSE